VYAMLQEQRQETADQTEAERKLAALQRLLADISHDLNNVFSAILCSADLATEKIHPDHPAAADVKAVRTAAERGCDLTRKIRKALK
jgi:signal transduction histidine kinase